MRRVAEVAEVSTAGIYIYFQSKEAILAAIRDETFVELHAFASKAIECASGPQDRLVRHLRAYLDYARDHPDTYRLTFRSQLIRAPRPGRPSSPAEASGREAFTALVADIAAAVDPQQHLDADKAHAMAEAAWAAVHGMASLVIDVPGFPASGFDSAFGELVHMVISGIRNRTG